jgi:hypothetical protein
MSHSIGTTTEFLINSLDVVPNPIKLPLYVTGQLKNKRGSDGPGAPIAP